MWMRVLLIAVLSRLLHYHSISIVFSDSRGALAGDDGTHHNPLHRTRHPGEEGAQESGMVSDSKSLVSQISFVVQ